MSPTHVFAVAGGGANINTASVAFHHMKNYLSEQSISITPIHGIENEQTEAQRVRPSSEQLQELHDHIDSIDANERILIITKCLGTIASLAAIEDYQQRPIALSVFSPPLTSPASTIQQEKSRAKRSTNNTLMRIVDFEDGHIGDFSHLVETSASIPPRYFEDIENAHDLSPRLLSLVATGRAAIFGTSHDWNSPATAEINNWIRNDPTLAAWVIPNSGHSLNPVTPGLTTSQKTLRHKDNCALVVETGLSLFD